MKDEVSSSSGSTTAARQVARRWLGLVKSRKVQTAAQLQVIMWLRDIEETQQVENMLLRNGATIAA